MIKVFHGEELARSALMREVSACRKEHPNAPYARFDSDSTDTANMIEAILATDLFGELGVVVLDAVTLGDDEFTQLYTPLRETVNNVYIRHSSEKIISDLKEIGAAISTYKQPEVSFRETGTIFQLADAYTEGDKRTAWMELLQALREGRSAEEIHGTLYWGTKMLWLSHKLENSQLEALKIKPFVANKFRARGKYWSDEGMISALRSLARIYHDAHRGMGDLNTLLEEHILSYSTGKQSSK
jgi:DNA polymerase III delta subunit